MNDKILSSDYFLMIVVTIIFGIIIYALEKERFNRLKEGSPSNLLFLYLLLNN